MERIDWSSNKFIFSISNPCARHQDFVYAAAYNRPSFLPNKRFELLS